MRRSDFDRAEDARIRRIMDRTGDKPHICLDRKGRHRIRYRTGTSEDQMRATQAWMEKHRGWDLLMESLFGG